MQRAGVKLSADATTVTPPSKRLLFDRRYGWVLDEWKEPSEEALSGGRGMFCILPLAKALLKKSSESVNIITSSALKVLERPELLSPKVVQATLTEELHRFASSIKQTQYDPMSSKRNFVQESNSSSTDLRKETMDR